MSVDLKPCPFCGGEADYRTMGNCVYIECAKCGCSTKTFHYKERQEAINAWNKRPSPWHAGTPTEEGEYLVLWRDTEEEILKKSVLLWHDKYEFWYDTEMGALWRDEYHAEVVAWQKIEPQEA